ncbi:MAG TPA: dihydroorotate dehydrogenase electron transfer subunit [Abditibacteriaceae bacterium]|jgi:dihydroorotate dehydrogenase electron transfer subunit
MQNLKTEIIYHQEISPAHFRLRARSAEIAHSARAGQFVHILPRAVNFSFDPLLRRAFSIAALQDDTFDVVYRVEGRGTALLSRHQKGDTIDVLGPLGVPFAPPVTKNILVGGGVGVPPLAMLAAQHEGDSTRRMTALVGARSRDYLVCVDDLERSGLDVRVATDDGSVGVQGRVTELLEPMLADLAPDAERPLVYSCGPLVMLRAVAKMCQTYRVPCQVSLEESMPCGVGVCNGCVVPLLNAADDYGAYRRICVDGPVMWSHEIAW